MSKFNTDNYVTVPERIALFFARYPEGSFQVVDIRPVTLGDQDYLLYIAAAYRTPDDPRPSHGTSWELVPGPTAFTRASEAQNAETSSIGRAIANLGIGANRSIASAEDIIKSQEQEKEVANLRELKQELLDLSNEWAVDTDGEYEDAKSCVSAFLNARGLALPAKNASADDLRELIVATQEVGAV